MEVVFYDINIGIGIARAEGTWRSQLASANLRSFFVNDFIWSEEI